MGLSKIEISLSLFLAGLHTSPHHFHFNMRQLYCIVSDGCIVDYVEGKVS